MTFVLLQSIQKGGLTYKGDPWHKECFLCVKCGAQLAGQKFTSKDEEPYCAECFANLFANKCATCQKPITGFGGCRFVTFEDKHWHSDCFNCVKCSESLVGKGFVVIDDGVTCPNCAKN
ncbi:Four and a half LIM domains protein 2 [Cichlidogyrus casuarinus]|uniref:Four and a half LIM domains protein 2 n=1 Tax=Cichlidogyrus casuarinus TaxID=1844966 RepID=A0ABD2PIB3_9PLAT